MIIDGSVYDVTGFISEHPGGAGEIVTRCGEDASDAFVTKGGKGKDHSAFAYELLAKYFIGRVGDVASDGQSERGAASGGGSSKAGEAGGSGLNVAVPDRQDEEVKEVENVKAPSADVSSGGVSGSVASDVSCTEEEVSLHASKDDCWMIIDGKVYDITAFFRKHPGGDKNLLKGCGLDASRLYDGSAGPHKHSAAARALLDDFFLCTVGGSAPVGGAAGSSSRSSSSSAPSSSSQESPSGGDDCGSVEDCVVEDALRRFPSCNFKKVEREDWGFNVVLKCGEEVKVKYDRSGRFLEVDD
ncbi:hypothetical protein D6783_04665 [Candidatus Woesearchaeota archaeon]|nr:MAG: hypothetical protein D6783_04665 [Candidatus Woesearchaeota archaeon]